MNTVFFKNVINEVFVIYLLFVRKSSIQYQYDQGLALNNLEDLICYFHMFTIYIYI